MKEQLAGTKRTIRRHQHGSRAAGASLERFVTLQTPCVLRPGHRQSLSSAQVIIGTTDSHKTVYDLVDTNRNARDNCTNRKEKSRQASSCHFHEDLRLQDTSKYLTFAKKTSSVADEVVVQHSGSRAAASADEVSQEERGEKSGERRGEREANGSGGMKMPRATIAEGACCLLKHWLPARPRSERSQTAKTRNSASCRGDRPRPIVHFACISRRSTASRQSRS